MIRQGDRAQANYRRSETLPNATGKQTDILLNETARRNELENY
jgi:hypothetical protein